jgi:mannitol-specific phosphotransferase system IIBC component
MVCESEQQGGAKLGHIHILRCIHNIYFHPTVLFLPEPVFSSTKGTLKEYSWVYKVLYGVLPYPRITLKQCE